MLGTIDAILCGNESFLNTAKMLKEVQRVLKTGGIYIIVSYGSPENRVFHLVKKPLNFFFQRKETIFHLISSVSYFDKKKKTVKIKQK